MTDQAALSSHLTVDGISMFLVLLDKWIWTCVFVFLGCNDNKLFLDTCITIAVLSITITFDFGCHKAFICHSLNDQIKTVETSGHWPSSNCRAGQVGTSIAFGPLGLNLYPIPAKYQLYIYIYIYIYIYVLL